MTSSLPPSLPVLRQLLGEATPGPWEEWDSAVVNPATPCSDVFIECDHRPDAALIVALRNASPALLDLVERQAAAVEAVQELAARFDDQAEQNDETLRESSPGASWRDRHSGLRDAYRQAADDLRTALSGITPTTKEHTDER